MNIEELSWVWYLVFNVVVVIVYCVYEFSRLNFDDFFAIPRTFIVSCAFTGTIWLLYFIIN